jgi:diguanylate cyclase (GGDEF)-like protein
MTTLKASSGPRDTHDDAPTPELTRSQGELGALLELATEIAAALTLDDVLETAAELACSSLEAAFTIERSEPATDEARMLVAPRRTRDSLHVPVMLRSEAWGWMRATRTPECPAFDAGDMLFLEAIADQVAAALDRVEHMAELTQLAFKDALTGLANRRALESWLEPALAHALAAGHDLALLICDLDHLKVLNDRQGHSVGDAALLRVAETLTAVAQQHSPHFVARLSGDEFCLVLSNCSLERACEVAESAYGLIDVGDGAEITISSGLAMLSDTGNTVSDLLRAADGALFSAKRTGRGRLGVASATAPSDGGGGEHPPHSRAFRGRSIEMHGHGIVDDGLMTLDAMGSAPPRERLEALLMTAAGGLDATAWSLSHVESGSELLQTLSAMDLRATPPVLCADDDQYWLGDYPETARLLCEGGAFEVRIDDESADRSERKLLVQLGYDRVLAIGVPTPAGDWLIELFGDSRSLPLLPLAATLRVLAAEAVRPGAGM